MNGRPALLSRPIWRTKKLYRKRPLSFTLPLLIYHLHHLLLLLPLLLSIYQLQNSDGELPGGWCGGAGYTAPKWPDWEAVLAGGGQWSHEDQSWSLCFSYNSLASIWGRQSGAQNGAFYSCQASPAKRHSCSWPCLSACHHSGYGANSIFWKFFHFLLFSKFSPLTFFWNLQRLWRCCGLKSMQNLRSHCWNRRRSHRRRQIRGLPAVK